MSKLLLAVITVVHYRMEMNEEKGGKIIMKSCYLQCLIYNVAFSCTEFFQL